MRKLVATELIILAVSLAAPNSSSAYDENIPISNFATVSVQGYNSRTAFVFTSSSVNLNPGTAPTAYANNSQLQTERTFHALQCAYVYGKSGYKGSDPSYRTYITDNYGFRNSSNQVRASSTTTPPAGFPIIINGATWLGADKTTYIFKKNIPTMPGLIEIIAHEYSHQHGALDLGNGAANDAYAIGKAARDAYVADNGAKCDGLMN